MSVDRENETNPFCPYEGEEQKEPSGRLDCFVSWLESQRDSGPDVFTRAYNSSFADYVDKNADAQNYFGNFLEERHLVSPSNVARLALKSFQAIEMADDSTFPLGRDNTDVWQRTFDKILGNSDYRTKFFLNLLLPIASNISERGKLLKAAVLLNGLEDEVTIADFGASLNQNLKRLAIYEEGNLTYNRVELFSRDTTNRIAVRREENSTTTSFNHLMRNSHLTIGPSIGFDLFNADRDEIFRNWARSNSFYMGELLDKKLTKQFDRLAGARPNNIQIQTRDICGLDMQAYKSSFDVVYLSTILYQLTSDDVELAIKNAINCVKPDGLVVVQDFVEFDQNNFPRFYEAWDS